MNSSFRFPCVLTNQPGLQVGLLAKLLVSQAELEEELKAVGVKENIIVHLHSR